MKTGLEVAIEFFEEERKFLVLVEDLKGNQGLLNDADYMYQEGVQVDEIRKSLLESEVDETSEEKLAESQA
jgi:hypothetical protein